MIRFNAKRFAERLRNAMAHWNLSYREAGDRIGISHATVHRIAKGEKPDIDSYIAIEFWLRNYRQ